MSKHRDFIEALGSEVLPHHLRRLIDLMLSANSDIYDAMGLRTPVRASSLMRLLDRHGAMGVMEIARALGLSHPLIIRFSKQLCANNLIHIVPSESDGRVRLLRLTDAGRAEARAITAYHRAADAAFSEIARETGIDIFDAAQAMRRALDDRPLAERIIKRLSIEHLSMERTR